MTSCLALRYSTSWSRWREPPGGGSSRGARHIRWLTPPAPALFLMAALLVRVIAAPAQEPLAPDYAQHIQPLLTKYCVGCHAVDDPEGGLTLESFATLSAGGKRGPAIVAGSSERSRLARMLDGRSTPRMPPPDNPAPTAEEIAQIAAWIDAGAKGPAGAQLPVALIAPHIAPTSAPRRPIAAVAFSGDDKSLLATDVADVRQIALASRAVQRVLRGQDDPVTALSVSTDGKWLVTASGLPGVAGLARRYNLADGALDREYAGHRDTLYAAKLSPDGALLATGGYDQQIILWDAATAQPLRTLNGHTDSVYDLAFSPDGMLLASASGDRTVKLWRVADGQRLDTFSQPLKEVYAVAFSPRGRVLAAGGVDNRIRLWDLSESAAEGTNPLRISRFAHEGAVLELAFSDDGLLLASSAEDRTVKLWDAATLEERRALGEQSDWPTALALSHSGRELAVGRQDGTLEIYATETGAPIPPAAPKLAALTPRHARPGEETSLRLTGENLANVKKLFVAGRELAPRVESNAQATEATLIAALPADLPLGVAEVQVETAGGRSGALKLLLDELPQAAEVEAADAAPQAIALPVTLGGALDKLGDVDALTFDAAPGQTIVCQAAAKSLGSKADLLLTLVDAQGRVVASSQEFAGDAEPLLAFEPPAAGRYTLRIADAVISGSPEHHYVVSIGALPLVTSCFPLSAPAGDAEVELVGFNLPPTPRVRVSAAAGQEAALPIDRTKMRALKALRVLFGAGPETVEAEPNDEPAQATALAAPITVNGRFLSPPNAPADVDLFRFAAKAGESWIIETDAARRGAPTDTRIEVLTTEGQPAPRVLLQATRDSYVTFRGIDSQTADVRLNNWEEMELNELVYFNGEVSKLSRMPRGPDSGFLLYEQNGQRIGFFDTSPAAHPLDEPCYTVAPHPIGAKLPANGLPTFTLHYANDDDGRRELGRDSRLTFTAPADGEYLVRVVDVQGHASPRHAYRLTIRRPAPSFEVSLGGGRASVQPGGARELSLTARRIDGFEGPIAVAFENVPAGWTIASPVVVEAGRLDAQAAVAAAADAQAPSDEATKQIRVVARATIDGTEVVKPVEGLQKLEIAPPDKRVLVKLEPAEITLAPGGTTTARIYIDRHGVEGPIQFEVNNLPHGVIVDNIGLNGVLIPEGQSEREIFFNARGWVPETTRQVHAIAISAGSEASAPVVFHVRRPAAVAGK